MEGLNEQIKSSTENLKEVIEKEDKAEKGEKISLGKFKDAEALYKAYNSLEAEFTKRCQRIKELEAEVSVDKEKSPTESEINLKEGISEKDKEEVLKEYLKGVLLSKQKAIVLDGEGVGLTTPKNKPKTIKEAGELAKEILKI